MGIIGMLARSAGLHEVSPCEFAATPREVPMRLLHTAAFVLAIVLTLVGRAMPSAAMVLYPWCVWYGSGTSNCGFTSFQQCLLTASGNGAFCRPNAWYTPYPPPAAYSPPIRR